MGCALLVVVRIVQGTCEDNSCLRVLVLGAGITSGVMWGECSSTHSLGNCARWNVNSAGSVSALCLHGLYFFN